MMILYGWFPNLHPRWRYLLAAAWVLSPVGFIIFDSGPLEIVFLTAFIGPMLLLIVDVVYWMYRDEVEEWERWHRESH